MSNTSSPAPALSFVRRLSQLGTRLTLFLTGRAVGLDACGNRYFQLRLRLYGQARRWVLYHGAAGPETVPPVWWLWLHHLADIPPAGVQESCAAQTSMLRREGPHRAQQPYAAWQPQDHL